MACCQQSVTSLDPCGLSGSDMDAEKPPVLAVVRRGERWRTESQGVSSSLVWQGFSTVRKAMYGGYRWLTGDGKPERQNLKTPG